MNNLPPPSETKTLLNDLASYQPWDELERTHQQKIISFLKTSRQPFSRENSTGHICGGAFLLSPDLKATLFTHHKKLNCWLQLGGHADGESNILNVALREAREESGIANLQPFSLTIFDLDVHLFPQNPKRAEPEHFHYEIRYLLQASTTKFKLSSESNDLKWFSLSQIKTLPWSQSITRMIQKWEKLLGAIPQ
jgi:8-oxo-dGTP pyrophosphatase MutT (NUDIX family)